MARYVICEKCDQDGAFREHPQDRAAGATYRKCRGSLRSSAHPETGGELFCDHCDGPLLQDDTVALISLGPRGQTIRDWEEEFVYEAEPVATSGTSGVAGEAK